MKLDTAQWVQIARVLLIAILAVAGILGYDIAIIQPREIVVQEQTIRIALDAATEGAESRLLTAGTSHISNIEATSIAAQYAAVSAPTAIATATPALVVDSAGVSNLFEARAAATPVAYLTTAGNLDWEGTGNVAGNLTLQALLIPGSTDWTPSAGQTLTPTVTFYSVNSSGAVSMTLAASCTDGQPLILYGDDANTVTVNDSNIRTTDGNSVTFGQYDSVLWVCEDNEWIHVAKSANS